MRKKIEGIKKYKEFLIEIGMARAVLAHPFPRMISDSSLIARGSAPESVYASIITEGEIIEASRDLFASGHYALAVQESYKSVQKYIQTKSSSHLDGKKLMEHVFSSEKPRLVWTERNSQSERDEHDGYLRMYAGAMLGIRNPIVHEVKWIDDPVVGLELIVFAQHLLRKAKSTRVC